MPSDLRSSQAPPGGTTAISPPPQDPSAPPSDDAASTGLAPPFRALVGPLGAGARDSSAVLRAFLAELEAMRMSGAGACASTAVLPDPPWRIGDFETLSVLGRGGFATVYLARQISLDRQVALKVSADSGH